MEKLAVFGGEPVRDKAIFYGHQYIDESDIKAVVDVMKSEYLTCGPKVEEVEHELCKITGAKYAVCVSNGTAALHAACFAAGVGVEDEVITTPLTFAASANCILYCGATPVFADVDIDTYNIDPIDIEKKITDKTKAVIAVDFTGQSIQHNEIEEICKKHNLILIEDGAHALGTKYEEKPIGSLADITTFSFHPVKTVTSGEGGAILTNSKYYYERLVLFRSHGITRDLDILNKKYEGSWYYEQLFLGYNYRMTDIQAALLLSQLNKLNLFIKRRKEIVSLYDKAFSNMPEIILQKEIKESDTARHLYIIQLDLDKLQCSRKEIFEALMYENVHCNVHYIPIYYFPYYQKKGYEKGLCPNAEKIYEGIITIPLYYGMGNEDVESIIYAVKKVVKFFGSGD